MEQPALPGEEEPPQEPRPPNLTDLPPEVFELFSGYFFTFDKLNNVETLVRAQRSSPRGSEGLGGPLP